MYDCGRGSVLNAAGEVEMDAMVMDGSTLDAGAVAAVPGVLHPVTLARQVMRQSDHVLLVGDGARAFANEMGHPVTPTSELVTAAARAEFEEYSRKSYDKPVADLFNKFVSQKNIHRRQGPYRATSQSLLLNTSSAHTHFEPVDRPGHDTVGAAAVDRFGVVACATSTGGITMKRPGRVGDSPLIGSGGYADNAIGACSATGHGESLAKYNASYRALSLVPAVNDPTEAINITLDGMLRRVGGRGGLIMVTPDGRVGHGTSTTRMVWASCRGAFGKDQPSDTRDGFHRDRPSPAKL